MKQLKINLLFSSAAQETRSYCAWRTPGGRARRRPARCFGAWRGCWRRMWRRARSSRAPPAPRRRRRSPRRCLRRSTASSCTLRAYKCSKRVNAWRRCWHRTWAPRRRRRSPTSYVENHVNIMNAKNGD